MELDTVNNNANTESKQYGTFHRQQRGIDNPLYNGSPPLMGPAPQPNDPAHLDQVNNNGLYRGNRLPLENGFHGYTEQEHGPAKELTPPFSGDSSTYQVDDPTSEVAREIEPVFEEGKSHSTVAFQLSNREDLPLIDGSPSPKKLSRSKSLQASVRSFVSDLQSSDDVKKKRTVLTRIKILVLFLGTFASTVIFAIHPELDMYGHQLSVARWQAYDINVTGITKEFCIMKLYMTGSFILQPPSVYTQNITFMITNPMTGTHKQTVKVIANQSDLVSTSESVYDQYFDFCQEEIDEDNPLVLTVSSTTPYSAPVTVGFICNSQDIYNEVIYAAIILVAVYVLIIFELIHRTLAAMVGSLAALAVLADLNMKPSLNQVLEWLDYETLALLFGMMTIVAIFCESGFFDWVALISYKITKGRLWPLITVLCLFGAVISAFLDNVTTILLLTPVTIRLCEALNIGPKHILIAIIMFSNIGGTATAIGDPPNVIIVSNPDLIRASGGTINFATFTAHMFLGSIFTTSVAFIFIRFMYRNKDLLMNEDPPGVSELRVEISVWTRARNKITVTSREEEMVAELLHKKIETLEELIEQKVEEHKGNPQEEYQVQLTELEQKYRIRDWELLVKSLIVISVVIFCFFSSNFIPSINLTIGWIAVLGAILLLVITDYADLESVLDRIEWATLLFFAALFVLMEALESLGLIDYIADLVITMIKLIDEDYRLLCAITIILWVSALASSFIDNIPFTTAMVPVVIQLSNDSTLDLPLGPLVYALAFGACLGGNGTLIGASANVVCAGLAENHGHKFSFWEFFKVGFPTMLVTVGVANIYLIICHVVFSWNT